MGTLNKAILTAPAVPGGVYRGIKAHYMCSICGWGLSQQKVHALGNPTSYTIKHHQPTCDHCCKKDFPANVPSRLQHEIQEFKLSHHSCLSFNGSKMASCLVFLCTVSKYLCNDSARCCFFFISGEILMPFRTM